MAQSKMNVEGRGRGQGGRGVCTKEILRIRRVFFISCACFVSSGSESLEDVRYVGGPLFGVACFPVAALVDPGVAFAAREPSGLVCVSGLF